MCYFKSGNAKQVSLIENDHGGYRLAVELHATLSGFEHTYAKALRGDTSVTLVVD